MAKRGRKPGFGRKRPSIFEHHQYREFLKVWFDYLKKFEKKSMRALCRDAGLSSGYLPSVLNGSLGLSEDAIDKLQPHLELNPNEISFLKLLVVLSDSDSADERSRALQRVSKFTKFKAKDTEAAAAQEFLSHWYLSVIREMVALPDFKLDPEWIQSSLKRKLGIKEIREALEFLAEKQYIEVAGEKVSRPKDPLECDRGFFYLALRDFHTQMIQILKDSIEDVSSRERHLAGYTGVVHSKDFDKVRKIIDRAMNEIDELSQKTRTPDKVYQFTFGAVPLAESSDGGSRE